MSLARVMRVQGAKGVAPRSTEAAADASLPRGLTARLVERLIGLRKLGYTIRWIALPPEGLTTLFVEGGDDAILLDPDPSHDTAWFRGDEIRPSVDSGAWIYVEGQFDEMSRHEL